MPKTLSTNLYYYEYENAQKKFCDGISALEPGSKYFLSKYDIDEIIVITSDQTITIEETTTTKEQSNFTKQENFFKKPQISLTDHSTWETLKKKITSKIKNFQNMTSLKEVLSACELYEYRIAEFLNESPEKPTLTDQFLYHLIEDKRRQASK